MRLMPRWCMIVVTRIMWPDYALNGQLRARFTRAGLRMGAGVGAHIGIMPRNGSVKDLQWFRGEAAMFSTR